MKKSTKLLLGEGQMGTNYSAFRMSGKNDEDIRRNVGMPHVSKENVATRV